jgi:tetratricopeptide (TPR) repeat protein
MTLSLAITAILLLAQARTPVDSAWDLLAKGDRPGAVSVLQKILQANPRNGEARLMLGSLLAEDGNHAEASTHLKEAVRLMPRSAMAHNALGEALSESGDVKAARASFEKAVAIDPRLGPSHANLGEVLVREGDSVAALKHLERAVALIGRTPDAAYPHYLRAKIYTERGDPEKAAAALKQAVSLRPDFDEAWSDLGEAYKALSEDVNALAAYQRSVEIYPDNAVSQQRLGAEYLRQGKVREAIHHLQLSFRMNPENQSTLNSLQLALRQDGQVEEAKRVKEKLTEVLREIDRESQNAFTALRLNNEGAELEKSGNLARALEKYRAAVGLDPEHLGIRVNFAVALLRQGKWSEGLSELREASRRAPNDTQVKAALADALEQAPPEFGGKGKKPAAIKR